MGIIAWIVLGLGAGLLANMLIPGKRSQGLIVTCLIGIAGALVGGWAATKLFHVHTLHGFFNLSTWLTAIAGAAVLLLVFHLISARSGGPPVRAPLSTASRLLRHTAQPWQPAGRSGLGTGAADATACQRRSVTQILGVRHDHHHRARHPGRRGVVGVAGVLGNGGSGHALTHGFAVFGYHVTGSTGTLFLYGIVVGAVACSG